MLAGGADSSHVGWVLAGGADGSHVGRVLADRGVVMLSVGAGSWWSSDVEQ